MKISRYGSAAAVAVAGVLALSACTTSGNTSDDSSGQATQAAKTGGTATVAMVNQFFTFNSNTANGFTDINSDIAYAASSNFNYINDKLEVVKDTSFGTYEVVSQDPLTVKYTLSDKAKWSDGTPVGVDDLILAWAVESAHYNDGTVDPATQKVTTGTNYFDYAGSTLGLDSTDFPEVGSDGKSITLKYATPFADWETAYTLQGMPPAHVVWKKGGFASADDFIAHLKSLPKGDAKNPVKTDAQLKAVADFWNSGFDSATLPSDPSLYLSDGPFKVSAVEENKSLTLVKNPDYTGDRAAKLDTIVMKTIPDPQAQIQALQNGEVDIISPQANADTLKSLEGVQGVTVHQGPQLAYDHIDLNVTGVFKDQSVREAFLKTVPRQAILDAIITPLDPSAKVLDSQIFVPSQDGYAGSVAANGSAAYDKVDIAGAKALLKGAHPTVRILYNSENPNRVDAFKLISKSATEAGFKVVNVGDPKWGERLGDGTYDATIFGWINSGVGVSGVPQIFGTGQSSNFNNYSDATVDGLNTQLVQTTDKAKQTSIEQQIDKQIFADAYGLPFFQSVGVDAESARLQGIDTYNPNQMTVWWNVWNWSVTD